MDVSTGLAAAGLAVNLVKELNLVSKEYDKATLKLKIAELSGALATVQIAFAEAQSEAAKKDAEIARLLANFKDKSELMDYDGFLYRKGADGNPKGRAYCPRCVIKGTMIMTGKTVKAPGHPYECPECKSDYFGISDFGY